MLSTTTNDDTRDAGAGGLIRPARLDEVDAVLGLIDECRAALLAAGIDQWPAQYPAREHVEPRIACGDTYVVDAVGELVATVTVDESSAWEWPGIVWSLPTGARALYVHRLAVRPAMQGRGVAKRVMAWAEAEAARRGCETVRLDAYLGNPRALQLYRSLGYQQVGTIRFPLRALEFACFDKVLGDDGQNAAKIAML